MRFSDRKDSADILNDPRLEQSLALCQRITRRYAGNFYYGLRLLPPQERRAMYAVYAWMRQADDLADQEGDPLIKTQRLESFRRQTLEALAGRILGDGPSGSRQGSDVSIWPAVAWVFSRYRVPAQVLFDLIDGQILDQHRRRYASFQELRDYCYKVAGTVGLVCLSIWGLVPGLDRQTQERARELAIQRGIALQLTNILRDLVEDARRDRLYLPTQELATLGVDPEAFVADLARSRAPEGFESVMHFQLNRARNFYQQSAELESLVNPACRPTSWAMTAIYRRLLEKIASDPFVVLRGRVRLSTWAKLSIGLRARWAGMSCGS